MSGAVVEQVVFMFRELLEEPVLAVVAISASVGAAMQTYEVDGVRVYPPELKEFFDRVGRQIDLLEPFMNQIQGL